MTSALSQLLGRNFAVGFLLPSLGLVFGCVWLLDAYRLVRFGELWNLAVQNPLVTTLLLPIALWFVAITLEALNFGIIRIAEGYQVTFSWLVFLHAAVWLLDRVGLVELGQLAVSMGWDRLTVAVLAPLTVWTLGVVGIWLMRFAWSSMLALRRRPLGIWLLRRSPIPLRRVLRQLLPLGSLNPFLRRQRRLYQGGIEELEELEEEIGSYRGRHREPPDELLDQQEWLLEALAGRWPHDVSYVLPTCFGNIVGATESYPLVMYNFEATRGWLRLLAVVPVEYRELIDRAKAEMDFLVNVWSGSWTFLIGYFFLFELTGEPVSLLVPLVAYASVRLSSFYSWDAAGRWGLTIRAAADIFLPDLWQKLGLGAGKPQEREREVWSRLSDAWTFRDPRRLPARHRPPPAQLVRTRTKKTGLH